jgi:hypothetical protein
MHRHWTESIRLTSNIADNNTEATAPFDEREEKQEQREAESMSKADPYNASDTLKYNRKRF